MVIVDEEEIETPRELITKLSANDFLLTFTEASQCRQFADWWESKGKKAFMRALKNLTEESR